MFKCPINLFHIQHFWSLDEVVGDLRIHVTLLLENRSLLFSETLQLVRACKREKNVPSAFFEKNSRFAHFGQKLSKIGHFGPKFPKIEVFHIFFAIRSLEFANFSTKPSLWSRKKSRFCIFWENSKMALFGQI